MLDLDPRDVPKLDRVRVPVTGTNAGTELVMVPYVSMEARADELSPHRFRLLFFV